MEPRLTIAKASSIEVLLIVVTASLRASATLIEEFTYFKLAFAVTKELKAFLTSFTIERAYQLELAFAEGSSMLAKYHCSSLN